jgi:hypothetical protein
MNYFLRARLQSPLIFEMVCGPSSLEEGRTAKQKVAALSLAVLETIQKSGEFVWKSGPVYAAKCRRQGRGVRKRSYILLDQMKRCSCSLWSGQELGMLCAPHGVALKLYMWFG